MPQEWIKHFMSSIFFLNHYQGFSVWKTNNIGETADLSNSAKYMEKKKECYYTDGNVSPKHLMILIM